MKIPDRHSWKEAALVGTSVGFLTGVTGVLVFAALKSAGCSAGLW